MAQYNQGQFEYAATGHLLMADSANHPHQTHRLVLLPSGRRGDVPYGVTVLEAARGLGVELEAICGGRQTCGKCQVIVERGDFPRHGLVSRAEHLSPPDETERAYAAAHGYDLGERRMACAARILGDVLITVPEESQARKQVIRKAASDVLIDLAPAVRLYYVEVEPASLGGPADWQRVRAALEAEWGLDGLRIDRPALLGLQKALRAGERRNAEDGLHWGITVTVWMGQEVIRVEPGYTDTLYGLAVDVGTTTIAAYLLDLRSGGLLATEAMMNPQVRFGEDLMSRVSFAMQEADGVERLNRVVIKALNDLTTGAARAAEIDPAAICDVVLVGNTVMHHLLLGLDPEYLGRVPFALATEGALDLKARDLGLRAVHPGAAAHLLPCIAGYVGADNVGVLLAEQPHLNDEIVLVVDVGTNAELLLGNKDRMISASSPTGPAFEGAQISHGQRAAPGAIERVRIDPASGKVRYRVIGDERWSDELTPGTKLGATGICGSGIIEVVAELYAAGLIDASGRFAADAPQRCPAVRFDGRLGELVLAPAEETASGQPVVVTQTDVRQIQLAKGALYAGAKLMMHALGVDKVDKIKLAGAFGSYIDPRHAMILGLIPDCDLDRVSAVGNSAGDGARIALLNVEQRALAAQAARRVEYLETGSHPDFQEAFVAAMPIPHASDPFPHLAVPSSSGSPAETDQRG